MTTLLQKLIRPIFGTFELQEFRKFLRMGTIFAFIIGSYWTLRPLKNAIFCTLVGASELWAAKTASILFLIPVLLIYTKLLDRYSREKMFYVISGFYAIITLVFTFFLAITSAQATACVASTPVNAPWGVTLLAYAYYLFVESYGSLIPSLFWGIATDTTKPDSAKRGFSFVVAIGQLGGIVGPYLIAGLPRRLGLTTSALSLFVCALAIAASVWFLRQFFQKTPPELLVSFHGRNEEAQEKKQEPGFLEGLRLLFAHKYLLCIFAVVAFPEIITAVFDLHFNSLASEHYTGVALAEYMGSYATAVNLIAFLCLLCGIGNITRIMGIGVALMLMPIIYGLAVFGFITLNSLTFLFILMASSKAINYALNGPAIKQLYIPTTHDVRFKAQAWIETFGSRASKESGAAFGFLLGPMQRRLGMVAGRAYHAMLAGYVELALVVVWFFVALYLGKKHKKAIEENKMIC